MKPRHKRLLLLVVGLSILAGGVTMVLGAFERNIVFFLSPTQVAGGEAPQGRSFRLGGLVRQGSVARVGEGLVVRFTVTDTAQDIPVEYRGSLPDLFRENKGVVAQGRLDARGIFIASEVLAKHDENYMPPEAAAALSQARKKDAGL